ncbi:MAG: flagellar protein FlgN [Firmicutes bacterium]|nr:flagellar protein FlgN [Bacillota bacterium]
MKSLIVDMIVISKKKLKLLKEILTLTKKQRVSIEDKDIESLSEILEKKDETIERINELDKSLKKLKLSLREYEVQSIKDIDSDKYINAKDLKNISKKIEKVLLDIKEIDDYNNKLSKELLKKFKSNVKGIKESRRVTNIYNQNMNRRGF